MKKSLYLPLGMAVALVVTACNKPMAPLSGDNFKVTPNPLEVNGGKVSSSITGTFPAKYFEKSSEMTITPVLVYGTAEKKGSAITLQGEKVQANNKMISNKEGGNFDLASVYNYENDMAKSELFLDFSVVKGKKQYTLPRVKVADGIIATSQLTSTTSASMINAAAKQLVISPDAFQRIINEKVESQILFLIQSANLRSSELRAYEKEFKKTVKETKEADNKNFKSIEIASYASPDGAFELNEKLAQQREKNTANYLERQAKRAKVNGLEIDKNFTAEDWDGFKKLVENSNIQDKELIIRVLSTYNDPAEREAQIRNLSGAFKVLADEILPQLRRSRLIATVEVIGKSDDELRGLIVSDPASLNIEETLYAATLSGVDAKAAYEQAVKNYPNDARAYNNLGLIAFQAGNLDEAGKQFQKSVSIDSKSSEARNNMGYYYLVMGDTDKAASYLSSSTFGMAEVNGVNSVKSGDYAKAVKEFGANKSNNAAIAQLLAGDYSKAKATLKSVEAPDATTSYLLAVAGARTNSDSEVINNLKEAVKKDASMAKAASTDAEFAKYAANAEFTKIIR